MDKNIQLLIDYMQKEINQLKQDKENQRKEINRLIKELKAYEKKNK